MANGSSADEVLAAIAAHPRGDDLARLVHTAAFAAADERRASLGDGIAELAERSGIALADAETPYGNVLRALERGGAEAAGSATRSLLAGLLAKGVALSPPAGAEAEARVAESLLWLAVHTSVDALSLIDAALGDRAGGLWVAVAALVRRVDLGNAPLVGRAGALLGAALLAGSASEIAKSEAKALALDVRDPIVKALLVPSASGDAGGAPIAGGAALTATGEIVAAPRGPVALALLGLSGILAALHVARWFGRLALRYRRPAELRIDATGVTVVARTELLGRVLTRREHHIPRAGLLKATREVRYPRATLYAGLFALALGSYFGISIAVDGARAGSPELLAIGFLLLAFGVALDYGLESIKPSVQGRCRVVLVPRKGRALAVGDLDPAQADAALTVLAR